MCITCGCEHDAASIDGKALIPPGHFQPTKQSPRNGFAFRPPHTHSHDHAHPHPHAPGPLDAAHAPGISGERLLRIEQDLLAKNDAYADLNRQQFAGKGIFALNFVSSPGSGKTTLLVNTIQRWQERTPLAVVEGDQQTSNDADRIRATGAPAVQINTGKGCHLDAHMVGHAIETLQAQNAMPEGGLLLIENVGNLVCPAAFDLGEAHKVVILSVTEGEDKPLKYPDMFRAAELLLLSKIDLLPHLDFDVEAAIRYARQVRPDIQVIQVSSRSGEGMDEWLRWLETGSKRAQKQAAAT